MPSNKTTRSKRKPRTVKNAYIDISDVTEECGTDYSYPNCFVHMVLIIVWDIDRQHIVFDDDTQSIG